jgi:hypothetical protein
VLKLTWEFTALSVPIRLASSADLPNQGRSQK